MVKLLLVAEVRPVLVADSVYVPAVLSERLLKVATPFCGVAVSVPERPEPVVSETVTAFTALVTGLPLLSSTTTVTAGAIMAPVDALDGCCEKANLAGTEASALMVKPLLVAEVRPVLVAERV